MVELLRRLEKKLGKATDQHFAATMDKSWDKDELNRVQAFVTADILEAQELLDLAEKQWDNDMQCYFDQINHTIDELKSIRSFLNLRIRYAKTNMKL